MRRHSTLPLTSGPHPTRFAWARAALVVALAGAATLACGCIDLDEPEIEDLWTRLDLRSSSHAYGQQLPPGSTQTFSVTTAITYRSIVTGYVITELRASGTLTSADVVLHPDAPRVRMAQDIDRILQNSWSVGRATRAITGWDHLVQELTQTFTATVPTTYDSTGSTTGGLFLISYLGAGEEIERPGMSDTLIVTPFLSSDYEILSVGAEMGAP